MALRRQQCTVRFQRSPHGPAAVLFWRGRSLNYLNYPKHHKLTLVEARRARRILMASCAELVADEQRRARRSR